MNTTYYDDLGPPNVSDGQPPRYLRKVANVPVSVETKHIDASFYTLNFTQQYGNPNVDTTFYKRRLSYAPLEGKHRDRAPSGQTH